MCIGLPRPPEDCQSVFKEKRYRVLASCSLVFVAASDRLGKFAAYKVPSNFISTFAFFPPFPFAPPWSLEPHKSCTFYWRRGAILSRGTELRAVLLIKFLRLRGPGIADYWLAGFNRDCRDRFRRSYSADADILTLLTNVVSFV